MYKFKRVYVRSICIVAIALLCFLILGSFLDLQISQLLYPGHESSLGQFFAAFGELPAFLAMSCAGFLLLVNYERINPEWKMLVVLCGVALVMMGLVLSIHEAVDSVPAMPVWVALLAGVFSVAASGVVIVYFARGASTKTVVRFVLTLVTVSLGTMLLVSFIKIPWGRARMWLIEQTGNTSYFSPWWQAGSELKKRLMANGVSADAFRSFPSGHTACAACAMMLGLLPTLRTKTKKPAHRRARTLLFVGCGWSAVVAVTRIWMGAHYLTDVVMAWLITLAMSALSVYLFYFHKKFFNGLWNIISTVPNPFSAKKPPQNASE